MLALEISQDNIAVYYRGRKIPVVPLYTTPALHYIQYVAMYVAKRLIDSGIEKFAIKDARAAKIIELACGGRCVYDINGVDIDRILEEAYYNNLADRILAHTISTDALVIPCVDQPLARALIKRAREYAPDLTLIASQYGGSCPEADVIHTPQTVKVSIPLGPSSKAALHTAMWAVEKGVAESPLTPLLDVECTT